MQYNGKKSFQRKTNTILTKSCLNTSEKQHNLPIFTK